MVLIEDLEVGQKFLDSLTVAVRLCSCNMCGEDLGLLEAWCVLNFAPKFSSCSRVVEDIHQVNKCALSA
jgi:hypothetical protein